LVNCALELDVLLSESLASLASLALLLFLDLAYGCSNDAVFHLVVLLLLLALDALRLTAALLAALHLLARHRLAATLRWAATQLLKIGEIRHVCRPIRYLGVLLRALLVALLFGPGHALEDGASRRLDLKRITV
jgi:hypothetical protein